MILPMEYLIGSIVTLIILFLSRLLFKRTVDYNVPSGVSYSQSYVHSMISPYMLTNTEILDTKPTQASKHVNSLFVRIVIVENAAYWIKDNVFYMADMDGEDVIKETARQVDTMVMDKVQLEKMMFIIEKLTEGRNHDSRNSGQS